MLQNSLIVAQQASEEVVMNAKQNAENTINEAKLKAKEIISAANQQTITALFEREQIVKQTNAYKVRIEALLGAQQRILEGINDSEGAPS
jgi:cell division initiation protein